MWEACGYYTKSTIVHFLLEIKGRLHVREMNPDSKGEQQTHWVTSCSHRKKSFWFVFWESLHKVRQSLVHTRLWKLKEMPKSHGWFSDLTCLEFPFPLFTAWADATRAPGLNLENSNLFVHVASLTLALWPDNQQQCQRPTKDPLSHYPHLCHLLVYGNLPLTRISVPSPCLILFQTYH